MLRASHGPAATPTAHALHQQPTSEPLSCVFCLRSALPLSHPWPPLPAHFVGFHRRWELGPLPHLSRRPHSAETRSGVSWGRRGRGGGGEAAPLCQCPSALPSCPFPRPSAPAETRMTTHLDPKGTLLGNIILGGRVPPPMPPAVLGPRQPSSPRAAPPPSCPPHTDRPIPGSGRRQWPRF